MQAITNTTKWATIAAFCIAAGVTTYLLFQLPDSMPQYSSALDLIAVKQLSPLLNQIYISVGVTILLGFVAITIMVNAPSQQVNQIAEFKVSSQDLADADTETTSSNRSSNDLHLGEPEDILASEGDTEAVFNRALSQVCGALEASQGAVYQILEEEDNKTIELFASYAYHLPEGDKVVFRWGEGLVGQSAKEGKVLNINTVPEGYIQIFSGLGKATPKHLLIVPIKEADVVVGMLELSSFKPFEEGQVMVLENYFEKLALKLSNNDNVSLQAAKV
ncbi:GAF domain-containing protein [Tunicatimonas pelagia]|uniref:GAF domain-containing protein n=1 Tax=Tunicatimonas pelagia TaxID=931531 RepID=UPI002664F8BA|nr:GAF domain-containing protein [Tunicatimonas pelagia]WKN44315.1 GAF domain-containing protein [Tunicatimonas pelagia]